VERLRGELLSLGFEVILTDRPAQSEGSQARAPDLRQELTVTGKVDAMIDVLSEATPPAVDVWIVDRAHGWSLIARVALEKNTENAAKSLAIRAIEVLRARLFESRLVSFDGRSQVPGPRASELVAAPKSGSSEPRGDFGFELGAATFASVAAVGPSILPLGRLDWALGSEVMVQATVAGFGTRPRLATAEGEARIATHYGLLGAGYRLRAARWLSPFAALSAGAIRTAVEGHAEAPREGHSVDQWSVLAEASLGAAFDLSRHYSLTLAAHAQLAEPYVAIYFADRRVASSGRPNLLMSLTVGVWP